MSDIARLPVQSAVRLAQLCTGAVMTSGCRLVTSLQPAFPRAVDTIEEHVLGQSFKNVQT